MEGIAAMRNHVWNLKRDFAGDRIAIALARIRSHAYVYSWEGVWSQVIMLPLKQHSHVGDGRVLSILSIMIGTSRIFITSHLIPLMMTKTGVRARWAQLLRQPFHPAPSVDKCIILSPTKVSLDYQQSNPRSLRP